MAISTLPLPAILVFVFLTTVFNALASPADYQAPSFCSDQWNQSSFECELKGAKFKIARLGIVCDNSRYKLSFLNWIDIELLLYLIAELVLEERIGEVNAKIEHFRICEKKIEGLTAEIDRLKAAFSHFEHDHSRKNVKLSTLEEEV